MAGLEIDDLTIGQYITVLKGTTCTETLINKITGQVITQLKESNDWKGVVLEIIAIDLPFIIIKVSSGFFVGQNHSIDIRQGWVFKELSKEYVEALKSKK